MDYLSLVLDGVRGGGGRIEELNMSNLNMELRSWVIFWRWC